MENATYRSPGYYIKNTCTDLTGAENVAIVNEANRIFGADGANKGLNVIKFELSNDYKFENMTYEEIIFISFEDFLDFGHPNNTIHDITSVDYSVKGYLLACIVPTDYSMMYGWLGFIDPITLDLINLIELPGCYLPDHVTTAQNGNLIVISCEGPSDIYYHIKLQRVLKILNQNIHCVIIMVIIVILYCKKIIQRVF